MNTLQEIKQAINQLSPIERDNLERWLVNYAHPYAVAEPAPAYANEPTDSYMTADEYLEFEQKSAVRHEFVAGRIYAMAGPSKSHNRIAGNLFAALHAHVRGGPCATYIADVKLQLKPAHDVTFYYPM